MLGADDWHRTWRNSLTFLRQSALPDAHLSQDAPDQPAPSMVCPSQVAAQGLSPALVSHEGQQRDHS